MVSYKEIEEFIYGSKNIDVDLLKRNTEYRDSYKEPNSPQIEWFWKLMREMTQSQRREFIRFCYAQPTLPPNDQEFRRRELKFKITEPGKDDKRRRGGDTSADSRLPGASTCFFFFYMPKYTNYDSLKNQILKAVQLDNVTMNAEQENDLGGGNQGRDRINDYGDDDSRGSHNSEIEEE